MTFISDASDALGPIVIVFLAAALIALALTPLVRRIVLRYEVVDHPEARRINTIPVPRGGGLAVCAAFLLVASVFLSLNQDGTYVPIPFSLEPSEVAALLLGGAIAAGLGAVDDLFDLRARLQLIGQIALALFAVALGISIDFIANPLGGAFRFSGPVAAGLTVFWIVGMINSINWIDGLDGLSSGVAFIAAVTLGLISLTTQVTPNGQPLIAVLCFALAGALLGFLRWNFNPPRSSPGRAGSSSWATRSPSWPSSASPRLRSPCSCSACRSSTRSGSSSGGSPRDARRSVRTGPTSITACSISVCRTARPCW